MDVNLLSAFAATCLLVSLTPGLCSMLCMSLASTIGVRRTQWMMVGELIGMGSVATAAVLSVAVILHMQPALFTTLKIVGSAYLIFLGWQIWTNAAKKGVSSFKTPQTRFSLAGLGFATAIANPKVWALYVALLPPFVDPNKPLARQMTIMLVLILLVELIALYLYAFGGRLISHLLERSSSRLFIGRLMGSLMALMGLMGLMMIFQ